MNLQYETAPFELAAAGWALFAPALLAAWYPVRQRFLGRGLIEHAWLGGAVLVSMLWKVHIHVGAGGLALGMLGSGLYAVVFGYARGLLGLTLALVLHSALAGGSWMNLGLNGVLLAAVPSAVATVLRQQVERRLPHNPFVFMIGNGMFSILGATAVARLAIAGVSLLAGPVRATDTLGAYLGAAMLLTWSEAIVSGMLLSALVVFLPEVVLTFREDLYARRR